MAQTDYTPFTNYLLGISGGIAPLPDSITVDPRAVVGAISQWEVDYPKAGHKAVRYYLQNRMNGKAAQLLYLRGESERLYARMLIQSAMALLVGRIDFRVTPDDPVADTLFTRIFTKYGYNRVRTAVEDFLLTGFGGIALTPIGISNLRPETTTAYPNFHHPYSWIRVVPMDVERAREIWGNIRAFKYPDYPTEYPLKKKEENPAAMFEVPIVYIIERLVRNQFEYYCKDTLLGTYPREVGQGYFCLIGDPRTVSVKTSSTENVYRLGQRPVWYNEREPDATDLPVGLMEHLVTNQHYGYNLIQWHESITEALVRTASRNNLVMVRPDLLDLQDPITQEFLDFYGAIGVMGENPQAAVAFLEKVSIQELMAALREIENMVTAITGVTPYMMGLTGRSDVASEIVAMQSQATARINQMHSYVAQWLAELTDSFRNYLALMPRANQEPMRMVVTDEKGSRVVVIGGLNGVPYYDVLSPVEIAPTLVGEMNVMTRRNELTQAIQTIAQTLPVTIQLGTAYDLSKLVDRLLETLNIDPSQMRIQLQAQQVGMGQPAPQESTQASPTPPQQ